ncbi:hypothetical protein D3C80_1593470 [compost metagenome]
MPGVGQAPCQRRGNRADRTDQRKQGNLALRQAVLPRQGQRRRCPVQAERREHQRLVQRPLAQHRVAAQQRDQRRHQPCIAGLVFGHPPRQGQGQQHDDRQHHASGADEYRTPAEMIGHQARQRARQQNAQ